ncbi:MAG: caspase family protein [Bacteroidales bacterium]|nr:caspase family protein [Bacteroidales bacterium]
MKSTRILMLMFLSLFLVAAEFAVAQRMVVFSIDNERYGFVRYVMGSLTNNEFEMSLTVVWTDAELKPKADKTSVIGFQISELGINTPQVTLISPKTTEDFIAFNESITLRFEVNEEFSGGPIEFNFPFFYSVSAQNAAKPEWRIPFTFARPRRYLAVKEVSADELIDKTPPSLIVLTPEGVSEGLKPIVEDEKVRVTLSVNDFFGVDKVTVNNLPAQHMGDSTYVVDLTLRYGFEQDVKVMAQDVNGLKYEHTFKIESRKPTDLMADAGLTRRTSRIGVEPENEKPMIKPSDVDIDIPKVGAPDPNRYALIIGNEDYSTYQRGLQRESDVEFAIHDAESFKAYALNILGVPEENIIFKTNATAIEMDRAISQLSSIARVKAGKAQLFVYYAGHGFPDEKTQEPYLIPVDVSGSDLKFAIKMTDFYARLTEHPSERVTVFLDACFSGGGREQGLLAARAVRMRPRENVLTGNLVVFAAASGDQTALPYRDKNHGIFTYHLLKLLKETEGEVTYSELSEYLQSEVGTRSILINQRDQNPQTNISPTLDERWKEWKIR